MRTPEQLKGKIRNVAKEKGLSSQEVLQMYLFERVIVRLSRTHYKDNFVLKGGFLIASMIGVDARTTMDMDTTIQGMPVEERALNKTINDILSVDVEDGITFSLNRITPIRDNDEYNNYRVYFTAYYGKIKNPMKMDITTGDEITPAAIEYRYHTLFDDEDIPVMAYNLETELAEKYETIISRNIGNTRARDFYDLHKLFSIYRNDIDVNILKDAIEGTARKRGSKKEIAEWREICDDIRNSSALAALWKNYSSEHVYAESILFDDIVNSLILFGEMVSH